MNKLMQGNHWKTTLLFQIIMTIIKGNNELNFIYLCDTENYCFTTLPQECTS